MKPDWTPLRVRPITGLPTLLAEPFSAHSVLVRDGEDAILVVHRQFANRDREAFRPLEGTDFRVTLADEPEHPWIKQNQPYSGVDGFLFDMQSIGSIVHARSLFLQDSTVRHLVRHLDLVADQGAYLRFGASGSARPGGEVMEYSFLQGNDGCGVSYSRGGYLATGSVYSRTEPLSDDGHHLSEERTGYSQTAWLRLATTATSTTQALRLIVKADSVSLLDSLDTLAQTWGLESFAIQIVLRGPVNVTGRVLKHLPEQPFRTLDDAQNIGLMQSFALGPDQQLIAMGTRYPRVEPEWTEFSGGRPYERRGHLHASLHGPRPDWGQHQTFHLRDAQVLRGADVVLLLTPVPDIYRAHPLRILDNQWVCRASLRPAATLIPPDEV